MSLIPCILPQAMRQGVIDRIVGEAQHALQWQGSRIPQSNIEVDEPCLVDVICKLYEKRE
jgi:hypothetical protein